jgi:hypothetical protein
VGRNHHRPMETGIRTLPLGYSDRHSHPACTPLRSEARPDSLGEVTRKEETFGVPSQLLGLSSFLAPAGSTLPPASGAPFPRSHPSRERAGGWWPPTICPGLAPSRYGCRCAGASARAAPAAARPGGRPHGADAAGGGRGNDGYLARRERALAAATRAARSAGSERHGGRRDRGVTRSACWAGIPAWHWCRCFRPA